MEWVMPCSAVGIAPYRGMILPSLDLGLWPVCKTGSVSPCLALSGWSDSLCHWNFLFPVLHSIALTRCVWCTVVISQLWLPSHGAPSPPLHFLDSRHHLGQFRNPWLGWRLDGWCRFPLSPSSPQPPAPAPNLFGDRDGKCVSRNEMSFKEKISFNARSKLTFPNPSKIMLVQNTFLRWGRTTALIAENPRLHLTILEPLWVWGHGSSSTGDDSFMN